MRRRSNFDRTIEEFHADLTQELLARSGAKANFSRSVFVEYMCGLLEDQGVVSGCTQTDYKFTPKGYAVDAWSMEDEFGHLFLMLADYRDSTEIENLTNTEITTGFNRLSRFVQTGANRSFAESLDESMRVAD